MFQLALCVIASGVLALANSKTDAEVFYVVPEERTCSTDSLCHTLDHYAENPSYFVTNSTVFFISGNHVLGDGKNITVENVANVTLKPYTSNRSACCWERKAVLSIPVVNCNGSQAGFVFHHVHSLKIEGLKFTQCGFSFNKTANEAWGGTLILLSVTNFQMKNVTITRSTGYGIFGKSVVGNSSILNSLLDDNKGKKFGNLSIHGGNMEVLYYDPLCTMPSFFHIISTTFIHGQACENFAGGLNLVLTCTTNGTKFILNKVTMAHNRGAREYYGGGNFASEISTSSHVENSIRFFNCKVVNGSAYLGSGLFFSISRHPAHTSESRNSQNVVTIKNTTFVHNTAQKVGAGLYMRLHYSTQEHSHPISISLKNCSFLKNQLEAKGQRRGGVAVNIVTFLVQEYKLHVTPQYKTIFKSCIFQEHSFKIHSHTQSLSSGTVYIEEHPDVLFENCIFRNNKCTGIAAVHSYMRFNGMNVIENNTAENGGGLMLSDNSVIHLCCNANLTISHNHANNTGGGIYAQYESAHAIPPCFFQLDTDVLLNLTLQKGIQIQLANNTAHLTGTVLYGGLIDSCYFLTNNEPETSKDLESVKSGTVFDNLFHYSDQTGGPAAISSDPVQVCLCNANGSMNCTVQQQYKIVSPGEAFKISAVVVGQRYGIVPGYVVIGVVKVLGHGKAFIKKLETTQKTEKNCTPLTYTIFSSKQYQNVSLKLTVSDSSSSYNSPVINIHITSCPIGFTLVSNHCDCVPRLKNNGVHCSAHNRSIHRPAQSWIGYNVHNYSTITAHDTKLIIFKKYCPRLYCFPSDTDIKAFPDRIDQDKQCFMNRAGILCGGCIPGHSMVFGTPRCVNCEQTSNWKTLGVICVVALAGLVLVLFLMVLNLTVTEGTINGIIFYANIIEVNKDIYFPLRREMDPTWLSILRTFVAWLNLDMGIQTCFYDGMDMYVKTWLQFLFPLYIWLIAGLMIWLSRKYNFMTRMMQSNGTQILATLILLSYAKLMRAIMSGLPGARLVTDEHTTIVWYSDGNVPYLNRKHSVLFVASAIFSILVFPFTIVLLFIKHLPKLSSVWILRWVSKLKPFFDTYTGVYKDKFHFWPGLLLLVRILLLIFIAFHFPNFVLMIQVTGVCGLLLTTTWLSGTGIYRKKSLDILEAWLVLNLMFWSMMTAYCETLEGNHLKYNVVFFFADLMFLTFCGIICCNGYKQVSQTQLWRKLKRACMERVSIIARKFKREERHTATYAIEHEERRLQQSMLEEVNLLANAPPTARYDALRESLLDSGSN